ncbi:Glutaredoxin-2, mitochondrial [Astathelohania contejeani]|uniref:Glutaredoxin-2, mitochondrial n=1 Tax=Astathelohania contejeani TaxID=164912 RepID=A0ABQ7I2X6_9MICR|nr:Glutaredoxin-2, mitochondrial [Thelohania contejeani]
MVEEKSLIECQEHIKKIISEYGSFMIGKKGCPYCIEAISILKDIDVQYKYFDELEFPDVASSARIMYDYRTFPIIVINGIFIGGCNELKALVEEENKKKKIEEL